MGKIIFSENDYRYSATAITANANTVIAVAAKCSANIDDNKTFGYSELVSKISTDGGKEWQEEKVILAPPARKVTAEKGNAKSSFVINPVLATAKDGSFVLVFTFYPECEGSENKKLLEKKKIPYTSFNGKNCPVIYDRDGNFFFIVDDGKVLDSKKAVTPYTVKGMGDLYSGDEFVGNIYLNGAMGKGEGESSFGAPYKAAKRSYIMVMTSADGISWSDPVNITPNILNEIDGPCLETGCGNAVVTPTGRIIVPIITEKGAACIYSDDNGLTWLRNHRLPALPVKKAVTLIMAPNGEVMALGKKSAISYDNGIAWVTFKNKIVPVASIANANGVVTIVNSKAGTAIIGGEVEYKKKKNKFKGIKFSKEKSSVAGGLLPQTSVTALGDKAAVLYINPDRKQISFDVL